SSERLLLIGLTSTGDYILNFVNANDQRIEANLRDSQAVTESIDDSSCVVELIARNGQDDSSNITLGFYTLHTACCVRFSPRLATFSRLSHLFVI
ncbi:hypothetical protein PILCRDRAFT_823646, partial [Piloderma croceum F 1598]